MGRAIFGLVRRVETAPVIKINRAAPLLVRQEPVVHFKDEVPNSFVAGEPVKYQCGLAVPWHKRRI